METDQIKGKLQNAFGKMEEAVGEAVGSQNLSNAGAEDRMKGAAKETWGNAKDTVHHMATPSHTSSVVDHDRVDGTVTGTGTSARDKFATGVENIKDSINTKMDEIKERERADRDERELRRTV